MNAAIVKLVEDFAADVQDEIHRAARAELAEALGALSEVAAGTLSTGKKPGAPKSATHAKRRKGPIQLCPAPRCKNRAAPSLGMLCSNHKDAKPSIVKAWREERRARKVRG